MARPVKNPVFGFQTTQLRDAFVRDYVSPTSTYSMYTETVKNVYNQDKTWYFVKIVFDNPKPAAA